MNVNLSKREPESRESPTRSDPRQRSRDEPERNDEPPNQTITRSQRKRARGITIHIIGAAVTMSRAPDNDVSRYRQAVGNCVMNCVFDLTSSSTATPESDACISREDYENANANFFTMRRIDAHVGTEMIRKS